MFWGFREMHACRCDRWTTWCQASLIFNGAVSKGHCIQPTCRCCCLGTHLIVMYLGSLLWGPQKLQTSVCFGFGLSFSHLLLWQCCLGPSALSLEEQRLLQSLDRLNERLKGNNCRCENWLSSLNLCPVPSHPVPPQPSLRENENFSLPCHQDQLACRKARKFAKKLLGNFPLSSLLFDRFIYLPLVTCREDLLSCGLNVFQSESDKKTVTVHWLKSWRASCKKELSFNHFRACIWKCFLETVLYFSVGKQIIWLPIFKTETALG